MARIITGHTGVDHITSDDVSSFQQGIVGEDDYLLSDEPANFKATINANGTISLCDADIIIQGTHARIYAADTVTLEPGTNGVTRIDSIIARYTRDDNGIENVDVFAKRGTTSPPVLEKTNIRGAGAVREVALWNVTLNGTIPDMPVRVIPIINSINVLQTVLQTNIQSIANLQTSYNALDKRVLANQNSITSINNNMLFIQKGYVDCTPKTKTTESVGTVKISNSSYNVTKDFYRTEVNITFPKAYKSTPAVIATPYIGAPNVIFCGITSVSNTGFTLNIKRWDTETSRFCWIAVGTV